MSKNTWALPNAILNSKIRNYVFWKCKWSRSFLIRHECAWFAKLFSYLFHRVLTFISILLNCFQPIFESYRAEIIIIANKNVFSSYTVSSVGSHSNSPFSSNTGITNINRGHDKHISVLYGKRECWWTKMTGCSNVIKLISSCKSKAPFCRIFRWRNVYLGR